MVDPETDEKSRSQIKREFRELKELGIRLAGLSKGQLRAIPLEAATREAVVTAQGLTRGSQQRQYRYLASLLAREDVAAIRAERQGGGNGRVYRVSYTATNSDGAACDGSFEVTVPHSQNGQPAVDDGQLYDSTEGC